MGVLSSNLVITGQKETLKEIKVKEKDNVVKTYVDNIKEPSIVVDGKVKKISKKSAFLLDMLTLDD